MGDTVSDAWEAALERRRSVSAADERSAVADRNVKDVRGGSTTHSAPRLLHFAEQDPLRAGARAIALGNSQEKTGCGLTTWRAEHRTVRLDFTATPHSRCNSWEGSLDRSVRPART